MHDGKHRAVPKENCDQIVALLRRQARIENFDIDIEVKDNGDGTVDLTWTVTPRRSTSFSPRTASGAARRDATVAVLEAGPAAAADAENDFEPGKLSERFEVGNRGPGSVSSGIGDRGGVSYGCYQMTSRPNGGTVLRFVRDPAFPFAAVFKNLIPGTPEFSAAWRNLAKRQPDLFRAAQHDFIRRTHYDPMVMRIKDATGIDVSTRSPALQECIWSTAVQHGPASRIPVNACNAVLESLQPTDRDAFDEAWIRAIYAERCRRAADGTLVHFRSSSANLQESIAKRYEVELVAALRMLNAVA